MKAINLYGFFICAALFSVINLQAQNSNSSGDLWATIGAELTATGGWDSIYLAEGRDDLDEGGLAYGEVVGSAGPVSVGTSYAIATDVDYDEWNLFTEFGFDLTDSISSYIGYTYLAFYEGDLDSDDHEFGFGLGYTHSDSIDFTVDYVFSDEANGYFVELGAAAPVELSEALSLTPYAVVGLDFGYRTEAYDGWNHLQFGVEMDYAMTDRVSIGGYTAYAVALEDIDKEEADTGSDLGDNFVIGAYVQMSF